MLRGRELYVSIASSNVPLESGRKILVGEGDHIALPTSSLPNGMTCVVFYVDRGDRRLGRNYAGLPAAEAFEMVTKTDVDTLLIQNAKNSWVAFPRGDLAAMRVKYLV